MACYKEYMECSPLILPPPPSSAEAKKNRWLKILQNPTLLRVLNSCPPGGVVFCRILSRWFLFSGYGISRCGHAVKASISCLLCK